MKESRSERREREKRERKAETKARLKEPPKPPTVPVALPWRRRLRPARIVRDDDSAIWTSALQSGRADDVEGSLAAAALMAQAVGRMLRKAKGG